MVENLQNMKESSVSLKRPREGSSKPLLSKRPQALESNEGSTNSSGNQFRNGQNVYRPPSHQVAGFYQSSEKTASLDNNLPGSAPVHATLPSVNPYLKPKGAGASSGLSSIRKPPSSSPINPYIKSSARGPIRRTLPNSSTVVNSVCVPFLPPTNNPYKSRPTGTNASKPRELFVDLPETPKMPSHPVTSLPKQITFNPYQSRNDTIASSCSPTRQPKSMDNRSSGESSTESEAVVAIHPPAPKGSLVSCNPCRSGQRAVPVSNNPYQSREALTSSGTPTKRSPMTNSRTPNESSSTDPQIFVIDPPARTQATAPVTSGSKEAEVVVIDTPSRATVAQKAVDTLLPPAKSNNSNQMAALMRPISWTTAKTEGAAPSNPISSQKSFQSASATSCRPELPGEAQLPPELVYDPSSIKPIKDEYRNKLTTNARLEQPLLNGWTLYRHQKRAILKGLMKRRVILALDMGLGKTLIGCVWSRAFKESFNGLKILVVCPVSVKSEWKRTAEAAAGLRVEDEKKASKDSLDMSIATWAKIPNAVDRAVENFVAIFDEAHNMQSMDSNRTRAALKLVEDKRCVGVLLLTGTPMKNGKPCNLFPLLKAVCHPLGRHQKAYERHFCQGRMASFGRGQQWIASGQANLKQLHRMIESNLLHMTKDEYLKELPPMKRETRNVPVSASFQKQYNEKVKNLAQLKEAMKSNKDLDNKALLGSTQELRVICTFAKIGATAEVAKKILEDEASIVIFTNFAKAASSIYKHLEGCGWTTALLTGETPAKKRQDLVDGFQVSLM